MTASALYVGRVEHARLEPREHRFRFRLFMLYLDLDELPTLFRRRWLWSARRRNLVWFRRADYMAPHDRPLKEVVLDRVEEQLGRRPDGAVRMLTHLRSFGYLFNPVTFYYCFDSGGRLDAVVSEITNTPWNERHANVFDARAASPGGEVVCRFAKDFHVSPFFDMELDYDWRFGTPGDELAVRMTNLRAGRPVFHAGLALRRKPITAASLALALVRHPLLTARLHLKIYVQAGLLWLKRVPFHEHPGSREGRGEPLETQRSPT